MLCSLANSSYLNPETSNCLSNRDRSSSVKSFDSRSILVTLHLFACLLRHVQEAIFRVTLGFQSGRDFVAPNREYPFLSCFWFSQSFGYTDFRHRKSDRKRFILSSLVSGVLSLAWRPANGIGWTNTAAWTANSSSTIRLRSESSCWSFNSSSFSRVIDIKIWKIRLWRPINNVG